MLAGKKILIAVSGSIAAYKTAFFVRLLVKERAEVKVIMTHSATEFIAPLTLATLSKHPVETEYFDKKSGEWNSHVELGLWADLLIIAPLTANTLGKLANGLCDNLVCATYLSARCPVMLAPAMDLDMFLHPSTQQNLQKVKSYGNLVIDPDDGELASGLVGKGRMAEPEALLERVKEHFNQSQVLKGKKVLITSGPTYEPIDPVRFIGNHSSGKMGTALANEFVKHGAQVEFITGPAQFFPSNSELINVHKVQSAKEMLETANQIHESVDVAVFAAAVSDFGVQNSAKEKIKRTGDSIELTLTPNPDIALELGKKKKNQFHVGFALETSNEQVNAKAKLQKKNFDLIVLNSLNYSGAGFSHDTNKVSIFDNDNNETHLELKSKSEVAADIVQLIIKKLF